MRMKRFMAMMMVFVMMIALIPQTAWAQTLKLKNVTSKKTMSVGSTFTIQTNLSGENLTFSSSKKSVAEVSEDGVITAKKKGKTTITVQAGSTKKKIKITVTKNPTGFKISKKSGSYTAAFKTKVTAKKGYNVYYTTGSKFSKKNVIKSGKSKTFTISKTTTLKLYPVKNSQKLSTGKLNSTEKNNTLRRDYLYVMEDNTSDTNEDSGNSSSDSNKDTSSTNNNTSNTTDNNSTGTTENVDNTIKENTKPQQPDVSQYTGDDSSEGYVEPTKGEVDDTDTDEGNESESIQVCLSANAPNEESLSTDQSYKIDTDNKLTILKPGTYTLTTEGTKAVDGLIEVNLKNDYNNDEGVVHIILAGVNLQSGQAVADDMGIITINKKKVTRAIITVKDDTVNTLTDTGATGIDSSSGDTTYTSGILCKKTPLTINGSGQLNIYSTYGNGIKATNTLKILDTSISVYGDSSETAAGHNGISGKTEVYVSDANLNIYSTGDALKTTLDDDDVTEAAEDGEDLSELGNMDLEGGSYDITSTDGDGISVYRTLTLNPVEMSVTTMNQAGAETDSSYKAIKAGTTIYIPDTAGKINADTTATNKSTGTNSDSNYTYADDTLHCNGSIKIDGGALELAAGDDGIHADSGLVINGGTINVTSSYEGLEAADITIYDGVINIKSSDDGMNAAGGNDSSSSSTTESNGMGGDHFSQKNESSSSSNYQIIINGGSITVDADGDGIDSNGNIFFKGGTVTVNGPTNGGNGALDYGDDSSCVCEISGGTLVAAGAVGMDVAPTSGSSQPAVNVRFSSTKSAETYVVIKDSNDNVVMTAQPTKQFQSVVMSCEAFVLGSSYTVYYGNSLDSLTKETSFTFNSASVSTDSSSSGGDSGSNQGGNSGWNPGGSGSQGRR